MQKRWVHFRFVENIEKTNAVTRTWKVVKMIPSKKKKSKYDVHNLRPIGIICAPSKVWEKLLKILISEFVTDFLHLLQLRFCQHHRTNTVFLKVNDDVSSVSDRKGVAILQLHCIFYIAMNIKNTNEFYIICLRKRHCLLRKKRYKFCSLQLF